MTVMRIGLDIADLASGAAAPRADRNAAHEARGQLTHAQAHQFTQNCAI
jgi:hypothetical protein